MHLFSKAPKDVVSVDWAICNFLSLSQMWFFNMLKKIKKSYVLLKKKKSFKIKRYNFFLRD